jgi:hypothetical protein
VVGGSKGKPRRSSGSERIFEDGTRRLWSAGHSLTPHGSDAVVFTCISDSREAVRAMRLDAGMSLLEAGVERLRQLLEGAPRVGRL